MPYCSRCTLAAVVLLAVAFLGGCDTDNPSSPLEEVEGVYAFTELRFEPIAQGITPANVLARLDSARTDVEVFGSGRVLIRFKLQDRPSDLADATATATRSTVRFTASTEADAARLAQLLIPPTFSLSRSPDDQRLSGEISTTANLQAFDATLYQGLTAQPGTLYLTLDRVE
ncbi:MAG TPA: hypothetical protein VK002_05095 [Rubricoccaceae bacterium]|nr:hypothetical protein [Rubricoccaceae bacterium]